MMKTRTNVVDSRERSDQQQRNISLMIVADSNVLYEVLYERNVELKQARCLVVNDNNRENKCVSLACDPLTYIASCKNTN